jgi:hypothetical protein
MTRTIAALAMLLALTAPALADGYSCSPLTQACVPLASPPSYIDPYPPVVVAPPPWPRTCPIDGPDAFSCGRERERPRDRKREH